jgi:hypothetical protein
MNSAHTRVKYSGQFLYKIFSEFYFRTCKLNIYVCVWCFRHSLSKHIKITDTSVIRKHKKLLNFAYCLCTFVKLITVCISYTLSCVLDICNLKKFLICQYICYRDDPTSKRTTAASRFEKCFSKVRNFNTNHTYEAYHIMCVTLILKLKTS